MRHAGRTSFVQKCAVVMGSTVKGVTMMVTFPPRCGARTSLIIGGMFANPKTCTIRTMEHCL